MKRTYYIILLVICPLVLNAQFPDFQWAKTMGSSGNDAGFCIKTDSNGNTYTTGYFEGIVDFDPGPAVYNLGAANCHNAYIQKLDSSGQFIWAKVFSGTTVNDQSQTLSLTLDSLGSIYITGIFLGTIDFDPGVTVSNLTYGGMFDLFILKLDSTGSYAWAKQVSGNNWMRGYSILTDRNLNTYVAGDFSGNVDFDPGVNTSMQNANSGNDVFILKLDSLGNFDWVRHIGGDSSFEGAAISLDPYGMIYISGNFQGSGDFNAGIDSLILTSFGLRDVFIVKYDTNGNFIWARQLGGTSSESNASIQSDKQSNIYFTGTFEGVADLNPDTIVNYNLISNGYSDIVILKLDSSGHFIWAKQIGGSSADKSMSLILDSLNNIYTTGFYQSSTIDFNPGLGVYSLGLNSYYDVYMLKLNSNGNFRWAKHIEGNSGSGAQGISIAIDRKGAIYTTGVFGGLVDFNTDTSTLMISGSGGWDIYIHKMIQCTPLFDTITATACNEYVFNGVSYFSTGIYPQLLSSSTSCDSILILNLTINSIDTSVAQSGISLTSNESSANYQWINCNDSSAIIGATNQTFIASTNISCAVVISKNGCVDTSACYQINGVGLANYELENSLTVRPNPSGGRFAVEFSKTDKYDLELKTVYGNTILKKGNVLNKEIINIYNQPKGIYILTIKSSDKVYFQKIVIE